MTVQRKHVRQHIHEAQEHMADLMLLLEDSVKAKEIAMQISMCIDKAHTDLQQRLCEAEAALAGLG